MNTVIPVDPEPTPTPSGDPEPSKSDIELTNKVFEAAELMGIQLLDHIVIGNLDYVSIFSLKEKINYGIEMYIW